MERESGGDTGRLREETKVKVKQKKSALLPGLITVLMVVAAVAGGLRMTDPDGVRLDTIRQELETITAENEGLTAQVEALRTETAEQKALPEAIQKQKDEGFRLLGELERQIKAGESDKRIAYLTFDDGPYDNTTDAILDILKEKGVHATFFLRHRPDHVAQIQREIREGHTLANHSYSHKIKAVYQSADSCIKEIRDQQKWLNGGRYPGDLPVPWREPYGREQKTGHRGGAGGRRLGLCGLELLHRRRPAGGTDHRKGLSERGLLGGGAEDSSDADARLQCRHSGGPARYH